MRRLFALFSLLAVLSGCGTYTGKYRILDKNAEDCQSELPLNSNNEEPRRFLHVAENILKAPERLPPKLRPFACSMQEIAIPQGDASWQDVNTENVTKSSDRFHLAIVELAEDDNPDDWQLQQAPAPRSVLSYLNVLKGALSERDEHLVIGQSLGGNVLAEIMRPKVEEAVENRKRNASSEDEFDPILGDLVVLLNPASPADKWRDVQYAERSSVELSANENAISKSDAACDVRSDNQACSENTKLEKLWLSYPVTQKLRRPLKRRMFRSVRTIPKRRIAVP